MSPQIRSRKGYCLPCECHCISPNSPDEARASAHVVSIIEKFVVPAGEWPDLLPFLFQCCQSAQEEHSEHDAFSSQHNLSMRSFVISLSGINMSFNYIPSPVVGFLRSLRNLMCPAKCVFQFLEPDAVEPTTNQTYGSLLNNLTLIKTFAAGILLPKTYICPVDDSQYKLNCTSLVVDAHAAGLEVFASGFTNDGDMPYDYRSDPMSEYLSVIDNGQFSVDGVVFDFPVTPSATKGYSSD